MKNNDVKRWCDSVARRLTNLIATHDYFLSCEFNELEVPLP